MKILMSAYACEPNKGSEPSVGWNWATRMSKYNEVYVITRLNNKDNIEKELKKNPNKNIHFYYYDCSENVKKIKKIFPGGIFIYYKLWQRGILDLAKTIIKEENIDLVHHITFNEYRTPGILYKLNIPFIWGPIGGGQFYNCAFKKAYFRKSDIIKEQLRNIVNRIYLLYSYHIRSVIKMAKAIIIADQSTERFMSLNRKYYRLLETAYDIEKNAIKSYEKICMNNIIQIIWVGGIIPRKGLKIAIDALGESNFRSFHLKIVGDGKDRVLCEKLSRKYGLEKNISFVGAKTYEEVNNMYNQADIFLFTSLRDTSGNVVLEAMSHGLPIIAFNHNGVGEIVSDDIGIKINIDTNHQMKRDLVKAIKNYYNNHDLLIEHGKNARKRLESRYSWSHSINEMLKIYKECISNS